MLAERRITHPWVHMAKHSGSYGMQRFWKWTTSDQYCMSIFWQWVLNNERIVSENVLVVCFIITKKQFSGSCVTIPCSNPTSETNRIVQLKQGHVPSEAQALCIQMFSSVAVNCLLTNYFERPDFAYPMLHFWCYVAQQPLFLQTLIWWCYFESSIIWICGSVGKHCQVYACLFCNWYDRTWHICAISDVAEYSESITTEG